MRSPSIPSRPAVRSRRIIWGALVVAAIGAVVALASRSHEQPTTARSVSGIRLGYRANPTTLPPGFAAVGGPTETARLDSITTRTRLVVYPRGGVEYLLLTGSSDALESFLPESGASDASVATGRLGSALYRVGEWRFLGVRGQDALRGVVMAKDPDEARFVANATSVEASPPPTPIATGDLSPYSDAVGSVDVHYRSRQGASLAVRTFHGEVLDPILDHLAPIARRTSVAGRTAYELDSGNGNRVLATTGPNGDLVLVAGSDPAIAMGSLRQIASDLVVPS